MPIIKRTKFKTGKNQVLDRVEPSQIIEVDHYAAEMEVQQRLTNGYTLRHQNHRGVILIKQVPPIELQIGVFY